MREGPPPAPPRLVPGLLLLCLAAGPARAQGALTLEEAVRTALARNERSLKAPLRVRAAEGQVDRARAAFLPTLAAGGTGALSSQPDRSGSALSGSGALTLSQPLLSLPAIPLYAQSRHLLESERWAAAEDRRVLAFDTARAFLVVLTTQQVLEAARRRLERARANQQNAEARAQAQIASTNDVTRARIETASAEREVAQAQGSLTRATLSLGFLLGRPATGALATPDRVTQAAETAVASDEDVVRQAEARRPDVRAAMERTTALRHGAREPLFRLAPTLGASAQVRLGTGAVAPDPIHDESVQLNLSWTLFDAGARYGDRKSRLAQAESQALDERLLRRSIAIDVGIARASLLAARESYRVSEDAVAAAQRGTAETDLLYRQGLARAIELIDATTRRFEAEVSRATARLAMEQAYLELRFALGLGPIDDAVVGGAS
jgi:outer membrane protein TolC